MEVNSGSEVVGSSESTSVGGESSVPQESVSTPVSTPEVGEKSGSEVAAAVAEAYKPNFKFKVLDKEHEIDEWLRPAIKDAESEKKIREIYEKAYGLDSVKADRQTLKGELQTVKQKMSETDKALETLGEYVRNDDFDSFFEGLNIPKQKILKYALDLVQREQMSPEQKAQWEASRQAQQAARYYQQQNEQLMQSQQQFAVQQREFELNTAISGPEAKGIADAYNQGMGNPEAFRDYVIQIGQAYAARGMDIPAQQAVSEAVKHLKAVNPSLGISAPSAPSAQVVQPASKPVIPNIQGRGTSPVKPSVKSLDDLRKKAKELISQDMMG